MRILKYSVFGIVIYLFKQRVEMTVEEFNILSEVGKKELLIDAKKLRNMKMTLQNMNFSGSTTFLLK